MSDFQHSALDEWKLVLARLQYEDPPVEHPRVLLCGAKVWEGSVNPDHRAHLPRAEWHTTDIFEGPEVDIVGDLQRLHEVTPLRFHGILCPAVLEHVERPWCAMHSMGQLLLPGGVALVQTHHTFPLHGYPSDYFRFSTEALKTMAHDAGCETVVAHYEAPCTIHPLGEHVWNELGKSYLTVIILMRKK